MLGCFQLDFTHWKNDRSWIPTATVEAMNWPSYRRSRQCHSVDWQKALDCVNYSAVTYRGMEHQEQLRSGGTVEIRMAGATVVFLPHRDKVQPVFKLWKDQVELRSVSSNSRRWNALGWFWSVAMPWEVGIVVAWCSWDQFLSSTLPPRRCHCQTAEIINTSLSWLTFQTHGEFGSCWFQFHPPP